MDIDLIAKHMPGLIEFKKRVEALLEAADAGSGSTSEVLGNEIAELRKTISAIGDNVAALEVLRSGDDKRLSEIGGLLDGLAGLKDMAEWFAANRAGLDVLLSIGDDLVKPAPQPDKPAPAPDPAVDPASAAPIAETSTDPAIAIAEQPATPADQPVT